MVSLTDIAAEKAKKHLAMRQNTLGLRLGVKAAGCSGMSYVLEFADTILDTDEVFEEKGVKLVVDKKDLVYIKDIQLDFVKKELSEGFEFINPNEKDRCGCGESFTVK